MGDAPKNASSLSDFLIYGGQRNPYVPDLVPLKKPEPRAPVEPKPVPRAPENSFLPRAATVDSKIVTLAAMRPAPRPVSPVDLGLANAYDIGDAGGEETLAFVPTGPSLGLAIHDEGDRPSRNDEGGLMLDILATAKNQKRGTRPASGTLQKATTLASAAMPPSPASPQPSQVVPVTTSYYVAPSAPPTVIYAAASSSSAPAPPPPPPSTLSPPPPSISVTIPPPPNIDVPPPPPPINLNPPSVATVAASIGAPPPSDDRSTTGPHR